VPSSCIPVLGCHIRKGMATDLKLLVEKEISRLKKDLARNASALAALRDDLKRHEAVYRFLEEGRAPRREAPAVRAKRAQRRGK
jgi:hypothetical protein